MGQTASDALRSHTGELPDGETHVIMALSGPHSTGIHSKLLSLLGGSATLRSMRTMFVHGAVTLLVVVTVSDLEPIKQVSFAARELGLDTEYELLDARSPDEPLPVVPEDEKTNDADTLPPDVVDPLDDKHKYRFRHVLTVLTTTPYIPTELFYDIAAKLAAHNASVRVLHRLSEDSDTHRVIEYEVACDFSISSSKFTELARELRAVAAAHQR